MIHLQAEQGFQVLAGNSGKVSGRCRDSSSVRGTLHGRSRDDWYSCMANVFFRSFPDKRWVLESWTKTIKDIAATIGLTRTLFQSDRESFRSRCASTGDQFVFVFDMCPMQIHSFKQDNPWAAKFAESRHKYFFFQASTWCLCPHLLYFSPSSGSHQRSWLSLSDLVAPSATLSALQTARSPWLYWGEIL